MVCYFGTKLLNMGREYHDIQSALDMMIPFNKYFMIVYVLSYVQWAVFYIAAMRAGKETAFNFAAGMIVAKLLCAVIFISFPTYIPSRPVPAGSDFLSWLSRLVFAADTPAANLFPSIHCLNSWACVRISFKSKECGKTVRIINIIFTLFVFASVVLCKQHVLIDIPAGIIVFEIGLFVAKKTKLNQVFYKFDNRFSGGNN